MEFKREVRLTFFGSGTAITICISAICYAIVMGVGWTLQRMVPNEQLIFIAAILTTIPIVFTASYLLFTFRFLESCSFDTCLKDCTKTFVFITELLAGILEIGGGVLFMVGSVNLRNRENVLAFGISAGVFAIISGLACICAQFCLCFCTYNPKSQRWVFYTCSTFNVNYLGNIQYIQYYTGANTSICIFTSTILFTICCVCKYFFVVGSIVTKLTIWNGKLKYLYPFTH